MKFIKPPTFQEAFDIEKRHLEGLISPKYNEYEIQCRAYPRAFVRSKRRMNFNKDFEQGFIMGAQYAKPENFK